MGSVTCECPPMANFHAFSLIAALLLVLVARTEAYMKSPPPSFPPSNREAVKQALRREYQSFFRPFEKEFYAQDVEFRDPLTSLKGIDAYAGNVGMLGGENLLGNVLFRDARILLHKVEDCENGGIRTRWTLRFTFQGLPWRPQAVFTGVSDYRLNESGLVQSQQDYWDSLNLEDGEYCIRSRVEGLKDFLGQLNAPKEDGMEEVPYVLLRRAKTYEVRRYPRIRGLKTSYEGSRAEGYGRLDGYIQKAGLKPALAPSLIEIEQAGRRVGGEGEPSEPKRPLKKTMVWALDYERPGGGAASPSCENVKNEQGVEAIDLEGMVVAVVRFSDPATEQFVKYYHSVLMNTIKKDGLVPKDEAERIYTVAQFSAIYSLMAKRNEVWIPLKEHDWQDLDSSL